MSRMSFSPLFRSLLFSTAWPFSERSFFAAGSPLSLELGSSVMQSGPLKLIQIIKKFEKNLIKKNLKLLT